MHKNLKFIVFTLILAIMMVATAAAATSGTTERITAHIYYGDNECDFTAYDVNGHKCAKLVDIAQFLSDSASRFNVSTDSDGLTLITKGESYTDNDALKLNGKKYTTYSNSEVMLDVDGEKKPCTSYDIDGEWYFAIADIAEIADYTLAWDKDSYELTVTDSEDTRAALIEMPLTTDDEYDIVDGVPQRNRVIDPTKPMIALTFDDGPARGSTEVILEALDKVGGRATFFVVGSRVNEYPDLVKRIYEQGSQIGNHSYTHSYISQLSYDGVRSEVNKTSNSVYAITGIYPMIGRPPYGSISNNMRNATSIKWFNWNVDTLDWKYRNSDYVYNYVINNAKDGDVILMHDLHATTGAAMKRAIPKLSEMGFQLVTIDEMAQVKGGYENVKGYLK